MKIQRIVMRLSLALALAATLALVASASAFANGTASVSGGKATFTAGAGDTNAVTYSYQSSNGMQIADVLPISAGSGCTAIDSYTVKCGTFATQLAVNLGDQNDSATAANGVPFLPTINGGSGDDQLYGGAGAEKLNGDAGADTISGDDGGDTINGGTEGDLIYGGAGNDTIDGGTGADTFFPDAGTDTLSYATRSATLTIDVGGSSGESGENDVIYSTDSFEVYNLGSGNDTFYGAWNSVPFTVNGNNGNDSLYGSNGADTINGGGGSDTMRGYAGDDVLRGDNGADDMRGDGGFDTVTYSTHAAGVTVTVDDVANDGYLATDNNADNVHTDIEKVIGSNGDDDITAQVGAATTIDALGGWDTINLYDGSADTATCGAGTDTVTGDLVDSVDGASCETINLS